MGRSENLDIKKSTQLTVLLLSVILLLPSRKEENMNKLIVLTGPSRSGKSEVAQRLITYLNGYTHHNIGDALANRLGVAPSNRTQRPAIGPDFLAKYGEQGYIEVLCALAQPNRILDGVRLLAGFQALRKMFPDLLHIHKLGQDTLTTEQYDTSKLQKLADITIPWFDDVKQLHAFIGNLALR
jgi:hypothetical protein